MKKIVFTAAFFVVALSAKSQNFYLDNSSLTSNRTVTMPNYNLTFQPTTGSFFINGTTGNVGVGTTAPSSRFHVNGNIKLTNGNLTIGSPSFTGSTASLYKLAMQGPLYINDTENAAIRIKATGTGLSGFLDLAVAGGDAYYSNLALKNDVVMRAYTTGSLIIATENEAGTGEIKFGTRETSTAGTQLRMLINKQGKVGIGGMTTIPTTAGGVDVSGYKLFVNGGILTEEVRVQSQSGWADYVFENDYKLPTLNEVKEYIDAKGHLPNMPSAKQIEEEGIAVSEMAKMQQEKIEELTLYAIEQDRKIDQQQREINELKAAVRMLAEKK